MYVYYENFIFGLKVKKKPQFWKQKSNHLSYIISTFIATNPGNQSWQVKWFIHKFLITWYMIFFFFSHFSSFEFYWNSLFWSACIIFFLAFWHLFARVAFRFIRPDSYKKCKVNSNWLCNVHIQWN